MQVFSINEVAAALLQGVVTLGLALLCFHLHRRHRKPHFWWWAVALAARFLSVAAIIGFLASGVWGLLFLHQVLTGWTALGFVYAALVFSHHLTWRPAWLAALVVPALWSYVAIFLLDDFGLAAGVTVAFLAAATGWAGVVFWRYRARTGSAAAGLLAAVLLLWALHHLDYPLLRARGTWNPWGYYLDIVFVLAMGAGVLLLVIEEQRAGLLTLTTLSGDVRQAERGGAPAVLVERPLGLRGVQGSALMRLGAPGHQVVSGVGACGGWSEGGVPAAVQRLVDEALATGRPRLSGTPRPSKDEPSFVAVLPLGAGAVGPTALVVVGDVAAPFSALDDTILVAVGEQVGAALEHAELYRRLAQRTGDLERLSVRLLRDHEEQRRRLGRELHDETAQIFSALKLQLGALQEESPQPLQSRFDRLVELVDRGSDSIRHVTDGLRPALLDDLGLLPAIRALAGDVREWSGIAIEVDADAWIEDRARPLPPEAELAIFRAAQEALSNVARHAQATRVSLVLARGGTAVSLRVTDDGTGLALEERLRLDGRPGRSGLFGMRERIAAVGGTVRLEPGETAGLSVLVDVPVEDR